MVLWDMTISSMMYNQESGQITICSQTKNKTEEDSNQSSLSIDFQRTLGLMRIITLMKLKNAKHVRTSSAKTIKWCAPLSEVMNILTTVTNSSSRRILMVNSRFLCGARLVLYLMELSMAQIDFIHVKFRDAKKRKTQEDTSGHTSNVEYVIKECGIAVLKKLK